ncbi:MAG: FAD-dependent oxidoreductase [Actinobacteria bacterium]|nr:FAD-dependent oxidoreductase [Actinomycetota bacterium]MSX25092.1 FAD-dependent oxidoreductase [Actinomycetota bacterium]MSY46782.1 FAD-dependent oxidoreductase [Actinomycetota bacterium]MSY56925.1 FAD-dependent oxidoreductase [Actinomycetota bacterium]MTA99879.1 FAD-dependent oxidoreductase [Actinomycetota bacterium]
MRPFLIRNISLMENRTHELISSYLSDEVANSELPKESETVVIGGGLLGTALTYYLSKSGVEVTLLERGELNREASGTNAGSFHFQIAIHQLTKSITPEEEARLAGEVRLQLDAANLWHGLEDELDADLGVHFTGGLMVSETEDELKVLRDKQRIELAAGLETQVMTGTEMRDFAPYLSPKLSGISYCAQEGHANPLTVGPIFALRAAENGARIRKNCEVLSITRIENNPTFRFKVKTSRGEILCNRLVNAAGPWTQDLSMQLGISLPMGLSGLHVNVTEPYEKVLTPMVQHIGRRLTLKQSSNNTFIIGGGWPSRVEKFPKRYSNYWASAAGNAAVALDVLPLLKDVRLVRTWSGIWAFTHDFNPILGESKKVPGYHVALVPTGFTLGPMVSHMLAEYISSQGKSNPIPHSFNPDRAS